LVAEFKFSLAFVVLLATGVLAFFVERPFCRYACPLGPVSTFVKLCGGLGALVGCAGSSVPGR